MNTIECWHRQIRGNPNVANEGEFYITKPEPVDNVPGLLLQYVSVGKGGARGLPEGIYVQTNLTPEGYENYDLRKAVRAHVCFALVAKKRIPNVLAGPQLDLLGSIEFATTFTASNGAMVLKLEPTLPFPINQAMCRLIDGTSGGVRVIP